MIDYLFAFADEPAAIAALPAYRANDTWNGSCVLPVQIGVGEQEIGSDPETGDPIVSPVYAAGYWLVVSTAKVDESLWSIPACMREADREAASQGRPYILRDRFTPEQLSQPYWVTPVWAGADYPFNPPNGE